MAMTGTDAVSTQNLPHYFPTAGDVSGRNPTLADAMAVSESKSLTEGQTLENKASDASGRGPSCCDGNAPRRTRTYNPLIKSQLLCQLS